MGIFLRTLLAIAVLNGFECVYDCRIRDYNWMGLGCTVSEARINNESHEIKLSTWGPNKTKSNIEWIILEDCRLTVSPKFIFDAFDNHTEAYIKNSEGLKVLDAPCFAERVKKAVIIFTDLEVIGENAFSGLVNVVRLDLDQNAVRTIHKSAFRDLKKLKQIDLKYNKLESLDDELFIHNTNLEVVFLLQNDIKVINAQLFSSNIKLETLDFDGNSIAAIEEGFLTSLTNLKVLRMRYNVCVDSATETAPEADLHLLLKECYANFVASESKS